MPSNSLENLAATINGKSCVAVYLSQLPPLRAINTSISHHNDAPHVVFMSLYAEIMSLVCHFYVIK